MSMTDCTFRNVVQVTDSVSLTSPDGQEITITTKSIDGYHCVSLFVDDGTNTTLIEIPRYMFDQMVFHIKPLN